MKPRNNALYQKARRLRKSGQSFGEISKNLGISKSTLHFWLQDLPSKYQLDKNAQLNHLHYARLLANKARRTEKLLRTEIIQKNVKKEFKKFPFKNTLVQKAMAAFLYWAEGSKTTSQFKFANTDPALCLFFLTILRKAFYIDEKNIKIYLYLHYYHNVKQMKNFWSSLLKIPKNQFAKIYIKSRKNTSRKRKNFAGICFIRYGKGGQKLKEEVLSIGHFIQETVAPCAHSSTDRI